MPVQRKPAQGKATATPQRGAGLDSWLKFAAAFDKEFHAIRGAFDAVPAPPRQRATDYKPTPDQTTIVELYNRARRLEQLFSETQRRKLHGFIQTRVIPDRLFNSGVANKTTAAQRMLIAAHILATGMYKPGSFSQKVHAKYCYHWAWLVQHYAGATPSGGPNTGGVMGSFDHSGKLVLGGATMADVYRGKRVREPNLPDRETPGGTGPLPEGSSHYKRAQKLKESGKGTAHLSRRAGLPLARFGDIRPGDWLWYYNANRSNGGAHSVIFAAWKGPWQQHKLDSGEVVSYRRAIAYGQGSPKRGGNQMEAVLGDRYATFRDARGKRVKVCPVTNVSRTTGDTAQAPRQLLPGLGKGWVTRANERYLRRIGLRYRRRVDRDRLRAWLRRNNRALIARLAARMSPEQKALLDKTNARADLQALIRLGQRLSTLVRHASRLSRNEAKQQGRVEDKYARRVGEVTAFRAKKQADLAVLEKDLMTAVASLNSARMLLLTIDQRPAIRAVSRAIRGLWRRVRRVQKWARKTRRWKTAKLKINKLLARIHALAKRVRALRRTQRGNRRVFAQIYAMMRRARFAINNTRFKIRRRRRAQPKRRLPYYATHPGWTGRGGSRTTGLLRDVRPRPPWLQLLCAPSL